MSALDCNGGQQIAGFLSELVLQPLSIKGELSARRPLIGSAASTGCGACRYGCCALTREKEQAARKLTYIQSIRPTWSPPVLNKTHFYTFIYHYYDRNGGDIDV